MLELEVWNNMYGQKYKIFSLRPGLSIVYRMYQTNVLH